MEHPVIGELIFVEESHRDGEGWKVVLYSGIVTHASNWSFDVEWSDGKVVTGYDRSRLLDFRLGTEGIIKRSN